MNDRDPQQGREANGVEHDRNDGTTVISEEEATAAFLATGDLLRQLFAKDLERAMEEFDRRFPYLSVTKS
jgi:hypothetical protein